MKQITLKSFSPSFLLCMGISWAACSILPAEEVGQKLKEKWKAALEDARHELVAVNDREAAAIVGQMLAGMDQPGGLTPSAMKANGGRLKQMVPPLVRRGAMDSAASLNWAQWLAMTLNKIDQGRDGLTQNASRSSGPPGPGGLVLYTPFDTPDKDGVVRDESGAGNHGRVFGATWVPEGRIGGAYHFDIKKMDDRIVIPNSDSLNPPFITVAAWVKSTDTDGFWNRILDKDFRRAYAFGFCGDYHGKGKRGNLVFEDNLMGVNSGIPYGDGSWHHVAATYDGQTNRLYIDGAPGKSGKANRPGPLPGSRWDLCIGNSVVDYGTGEFLAFDGLIDEVRIYNRALTAEEIRALCESQSKVGRTSEAAQPTMPSGIQSAPSPADRIKQIKQLMEQGLIDKQEYDRRVKEILDAI